MDVTRRAFVHAVGTAMALSGGLAKAARGGDLGKLDLPHPRDGRLGLELYSLRNELKKDLAGTLKLVSGWGFQEVELAGFPAMPAEDAARALRAAGLRAVSQFVDYERLRDDFAGVVRDAHTLGLEMVICGWIPHRDALTAQDVDAAISSFNKWGAAARAEKLRLGYHIHGYEFVQGAAGTQLDTLFKGTDPQFVDFEMDVFWVVRGGGEPVALLDRYGSRIRAVHLKDIARGTPTGVTTGQAPDEASVTLGTGTIDWRAVMRAATKARVRWYFIEDEHPQAATQIPQSLDYLRKLTV
jgi:sugar phosphate isomerase/epimerase